MQQRSRTLPVVAIVLVALAAAGIVAILLSGGSGGDAKKASTPPPAASGPSVVQTRLTDFKITPSASDVPAGKVTFVATNAGKEEHEMVVVRTAKPAGSLMKGKEASEAGAVDEIPEFDAGLTKRLSLDLKPGHYVLLCNVPGHYKAGMFTDFTVK
jgi:uncharacterized cupredoxin-like copper-binding protein